MEQPINIATAGILPETTAEPAKKKRNRPDFDRPKILGLKQLLQKNYAFLQGLPPEFTASFGDLVKNFVMLVYGESGNGKSNFIMQLLKALMPHGNVLYVSLEEGTESTMQLMALRHLSEDSHSGKIQFADTTMTYQALCWQLDKKKQAQFIVIDSVQYWHITYEQYKRLKERFPKKSFIFISHAEGSSPDGHTAKKIKYDSGIKVRVEGYIAFVKSRYGGNIPYLIWEGDDTKGAKAYWGSLFKDAVAGKSLKAKAAKKSKPKKEKKEGKDNAS